MSVKWGLPMRKNEKGATPVGERGELLGRLSQASDNVEEEEQLKIQRLKQGDKEKSSGAGKTEGERE